MGYTIEMNGIRVGEGESDETLVVPPGGTEELDTRTVIRNDRLDEWWVSHLRNDQVTDLRIDFYATVELPTGLEVRVPLDRLTYETTIETDVFDNKAEAAGGASGNDAAGNRTPSPTPTPDSGLVDAPTTPPLDSPVSTPLPESPVGPTPTDDGGLLG